MPHPSHALCCVYSCSVILKLRCADVMKIMRIYVLYKILDIKYIKHNAPNPYTHTPNPFP